MCVCVCVACGVCLVGSVSSGAGVVRGEVCVGACVCVCVCVEEGGGMAVCGL